MPAITRFEGIEAWKTARELTRTVYPLTDQGNFAKDFGSRNQIQLGDSLSISPCARRRIRV